MKKVVVYNTLHNGNDACFLLTIRISGKLAIFRSGDENWMMLPEIPPMPYTDVCVFDGQPIAVDSTGRTVAVGPDLSLDFVAEAVFGGDTKLLVESDGELLLVDKYLTHFGVTCTFNPEGVYQIETERAARFVVFRLDEKEKKWVKLKSLGDKILVMAEDFAFSVSASDLCIENGNCVIYRDNVYATHFSTTGRRIGVFCLDNHIGIHLCLIFLINLFWPPSLWAWLR
ncbi:F-box protein SKIP23 [Trifolium repens]|nr:F-box protein SKIP23 [Trifolium repens]